MQKKLIRLYKSLSPYRWSLLKNNLNPNKQKIVSLKDRVVLKNLIPGSVLSLDCLGLHYTGLIDDLFCINWPDEKTQKQHNNLLMLNCEFLKYKDLDNITLIVADALPMLKSGGHLIIGFNFQFVKFNRLKYNFQSAVQHWINTLKQEYNLDLLTRIDHGLPKTDNYGDCLYIFKLNPPEN
jgi:hypothetical protein